mgnify:CR=1 FL=1
MILRKFMRPNLAAALCLTLAAPVAAEKLSLPDISGFLNGITTAQARFEQINDDGSVSTGEVLIKRPGKMRFEYDPPAEALVLASGGAVAIFDRKSNQPPETYPLKRTPLSLILLPNIDLEAANMVVGHEEDEAGTATLVRAQDPENPEYGMIELKFTGLPEEGLPVELLGWVIYDGSGGQTHVQLDDMNFGAQLNNRLFDIQSEFKSNDR